MSVTSMHVKKTDDDLIAQAREYQKKLIDLGAKYDTVDRNSYIEICDGFMENAKEYYGNQIHSYYSALGAVMMEIKDRDINFTWEDL